MLDFENIGEKFTATVNSREWKKLQKVFNNCNDIYVLGHGGNLAVADHAAVDITRLSNGTKNAMCPGSAIVATSLINDSGFDQWMVAWLTSRTSTRTKSQMKKSLVLGISSSGNSIDILTHGSGNVCPPIGQNTPEELEKLNWKGNKIRKHSYPDEAVNIGIDFDGVIHKCSKGYYDGTIYDDPMEGAYEALERISQKYTVIMYTAKAKPDRGLVNGKTGTELVWEWLKKHDMAKFVSKVTAEKPRAVCYIDDKAIEFTDWKSCFESLESKEIL